MPLTYYRYDDPNAPSASSNATRGFVAWLVQLMTTGYSGKPGCGWTIIKDDGQTYGGQVIIQHPSGQFIVITTEDGSHIQFGLTDAADATNGVTGNYKSGSYNGANGYVQRYNDWSTSTAENWFAFYDSDSETFVWWAIDATYDDYNSGRNSTGWGNQCSGYIGTLKPPIAGGYAPLVVFAGSPAQYDHNALWEASTRSWATYGGHTGTVLKPYADETVTDIDAAFVPISQDNNNNLAAPDTTFGAQFIGLQPLNVLMVRGNYTQPSMEFIGSIRGFYFLPNCFDMSDNPIDYVARWIDPNAASYPTLIANPLQADGNLFYSLSVPGSQPTIIGDKPEWWS